MGRLVIVALMLVGSIGCELRIEPNPGTVKEKIHQRKQIYQEKKEKCPFENCPPANIPFVFRQGNYGGGSCNHAAMITVLRYHRMHGQADRWRSTRWGGVAVEGLARLAERDRLRFAYTLDGDAAFLAWCSRTRRPAAIHYYSNHAVTFCGYVKGKAVLIDNNNTRRLIRVPKAKFIRNWKYYGGRAIAVLYTPPFPKPWI